MSKTIYTVTESNIQLNIIIKKINEKAFVAGFSYFKKSPEKIVSYIDCDNKLFTTEEAGYVFACRRAKTYLFKIKEGENLVSKLMEKYNKY